MKKTVTLLSVVLVLALLGACSLPGNARPSPAPTAEPESEAEQETAVGLPNPVKPSSAEEIFERFVVELNAPEGAQDVSYTIIEGERPIAQLRFTLNGQSYTCRAAKAESYEDISGMYYDWELVSVEDGEDGSIRLIPGGAGVWDRFDAQSGTIACLSLDSGASEETLKAAARLAWGEGESSGTELEELLSALHESYFPGTAGSSLSAAANAAKLADFFAESGVSPDAVFEAVRSYSEGLTDEEKELFDLQRNGAVSAFSYLTDEGGEGILQDCGYSPVHFPWAEENVRDCFVALLGSD